MRFRMPGWGPLPGSFRGRLEFVPRGAGAPRWEHQSANRSGRFPGSGQQKHYREPPIASDVG
jgi:hypothetical protein